MPENSIRPWWLLCSAALLGIGLAIYSQTRAFYWDEGFHLLAAQLIASGRRPYVDFLLAQTPLNAYWSAAWMRVFGESWRVIHGIDAVLMTTAVVLAAGFLRSRWRELGTAFSATSATAGWITVLVLAGADPLIVQYGLVGQAYALALLLLVAAFRLTTAAVRRDVVLLAAAAGLFSGAAAGSTLLTAPAAPVLLLWTLWCSPPAKRLSRAAAFVAGAVVALLPLLVLLARSPRQVIFDVYRYHMFFRLAAWPGATQHDLEIFASWIGSPQALVLGGLAAAGIWFIGRKSGWERDTRREFYLCGWLALALGLYVCTPHPTFAQYYIFTVPFLAVLSAVGLFAVTTQLGAKRALWPVFGVCVLTCMGLAKEIYDDDNYLWQNMEKVAHKVDEVTPPGAPLYADEPTYFLTKRPPPLGNEYLDTHKLNLPPTFAELVRAVPQSEWDRRIAAGAFATAETCLDEAWIKEHKLREIYRQQEKFEGDCFVFWDRVEGKAGQ